MQMSSSKLATALAHAAGEANMSLVSAAPDTKDTKKDTKKDPLARCEVCGNDCESPMEIRLRGRVAIFDCFECAIHLLALACARCRCRIIGHGVEAAGSIYCCSHCATVAKKG
jgi:hypothetical protein